MKIEEWPIDKVIPYENNPRNNDGAVDSTANSIKEFGWQQPIVVDKDGVIIVGHTRLKAAKKLKLDQVPVTIAESLTDEQVKAYRLADNKTGELAEWESKMLDEELGEILNINMEQFGFEPEEDEEIEEEPEVEFSQELNEENNYIVLKFDNSVDQQQVITIFDVKPVQDTNTKMIRKGVGRVLDGSKLVNGLIAKGVNIDEYFND